MKKLRVAFLALAVLALCVSSAFAGISATATSNSGGFFDEYYNLLFDIAVDASTDLDVDAGDTISFDFSVDASEDATFTLSSVTVKSSADISAIYSGIFPASSDEAANALSFKGTVYVLSSDNTEKASADVVFDIADWTYTALDVVMLTEEDTEYVSSDEAAKVTSSADYAVTVKVSFDADSLAVDSIDVANISLPYWLEYTAGSGDSKFASEDITSVTVTCNASIDMVSEGTVGSIVVPFARNAVVSTDDKPGYVIIEVTYSTVTSDDASDDVDTVTSLDLSADVTTVSLKVGETKTVTLTAVSNDYEISGDVVISVDSIPSGLTVAASGDAGSFDATYAITGVTVGTYSVKFTVADDSESGDLTISVTVTSDDRPDVPAAPTLTTEMTAEELSAISDLIKALVPGGSTSFDVKFTQPLSTWYGYWKLGSAAYNKSGSASAAMAAAFYAAADDDWFTITPSESDPTHTAHFDLEVPEDIDAGTYTLAAGGIIGSGWANADEIGKEATPYELGTFTVSESSQELGGSSSGCDAGFGALALALIATPLFLRKRS